MNPRQTAFRICSVAVVIATSFTPAAPASAGDPPRITPRPGTLGAFARGVSLSRAAPRDDTGRLILTNDLVAEVASGVSITLGTVDSDGIRRSAPMGGTDAAEKARWRNLYRRQRQVIHTLEKRRAKIVFEMDQVNSLGLTAKTLARLDRLQATLDQVDLEIANENKELARIVRDARRHGAEPGWFR